MNNITNEKKLTIFDPFKAYSHAEFLSIPRMVGSDGEKRAKDYCIETLRSFGINAHDQKFSFTNLPDILTRILPFTFGTILWILSIIKTQSAWLTLILIFTAVLGVLVIFWWIPLKRLHEIPGKLESSNIIGHIAAQSTVFRHIVFMAHFDSKSQVLPIAVRSICYIGLLLSYIVAIASYPLSFYWSSFAYQSIILICGNGAMLFGVLLLINKIRNESPGAADNACGVAIVLELARIFSKKPLQHVQISFLLTGAEEYCMAGAFGYLRKEPVLGPNVQFVNIDGVGHDSPIRIISQKNKFCHSKINELVMGLTNAAQAASLSIVKISSVIGIGFDHIAMTENLYPAITLSSGNIPMLLRIHSSRDKINMIEPVALDGIGKLCETYAREMDKN